MKVPFVPRPGNLRRDTTRTVRAPRGTEMRCKSWLTEAPYRMLQNNLDPEVAERPEELVVYAIKTQEFAIRANAEVPRRVHQNW